MARISYSQFSQWDKCPHMWKLNYVDKVGDVMKGVDHLKVLQKDINELLAEVTNKDSTFWELTQRNDCYLSAEQCLEYGIIDKII